MKGLFRPVFARRGTRGAGAIEYALLIFLIIIAGFLAYKFLGGQVGKSTEQAKNKFDKSGEGAHAAAGGAGAGGGAGGANDNKGGTAAGTQGGANQPAGGPPAHDNSKAGTPGGAAVATVETKGGGPPPDNAGPRSKAAADEGGGVRTKNWVKLIVIVIVVAGLMAAVFRFGKKGKKAA